MALLYSYQNREPAPLPERIRLDDGMTVRPPLSAEVLDELGYAGPFSVPSFDEKTQSLVWDINDMVYRVYDLAPEEIEKRSRAALEAAADYRVLYNALTTSSTYQEIVTQATENLPLTVACTQFLSAMVDAKLGHPNLIMLQHCIDAVIAAANLTDEQLQDIYQALNAAGLWGLISLGDFEPEISVPKTTAVSPSSVASPPINPEGALQTPVTVPDTKETVDFEGSTTTSGITTSGSLVESAGEDTVIFDDPLA